VNKLKNKILLSIIILLSITLVLEVSFKSETNFSLYEKEIGTQDSNEQIETYKKEEKKIEETKDFENDRIIKVYDPKTKEINEMKLEDYIIGVVAAEMPVSFESEALKAQAVAARTFALYKMEHRNLDYDIIIGVSDQAYNNLDEMHQKWQNNFEQNYNKVKEAVLNTQNEIITYQGKTIESFYFSMSNGYTENCELVFQEQLPYLTSVESNWDNENIKNYEVQKKVSKSEFCQILSINCNNIIISDIKRTEAKRVDTITINDKTLKGVEMRKLLSLRSTDFDIEIGEEVVITTRGFGHGVGMSQYGANGMAKEGKDYQQILKYYYQNIEISKI